MRLFAYSYFAWWAKAKEMKNAFRERYKRAWKGYDCTLTFYHCLSGNWSFFFFLPFLHPFPSSFLPSFLSSLLSPFLSFFSPFIPHPYNVHSLNLFLSPLFCTTFKTETWKVCDSEHLDCIYDWTLLNFYINI